MDRPSLLRQFCLADRSTFPLHRAFFQVMHLIWGAIFRSAEAVRIAQKNRAQRTLSSSP
ncbi:MAG: hypothetical protein O9273_01970 [Acetobacteraceae bacterium]|jgi:hypothetical protein|nr:hypothetical protein [Acetobacteraceae bacterium]